MTKHCKKCCSVLSIKWAELHATYNSVKLAYACVPCGKATSRTIDQFYVYVSGIIEVEVTKEDPDYQVWSLTMKKTESDDVRQL